MKRLIVLLLFVLVLPLGMSLSAQDEGKHGIVKDSTTVEGVRIVDYIPQGVCSRSIHIELDKNGVITTVRYTGGCNGNTKGIGALVEGMAATEAIERLEGIKCNKKPTSCPDQLAKALKEMLNKR